MKLHSYGLSVSDVLTAVGQQNALVSPGKTGDEPASAGQGVTYPITVKGQLTSVEAFRNITLKSDASGARLKLSDVARVESGLQSYAFSIRENGVPATAAAIQLSPGANAMSTASGVRARIDELSGVTGRNGVFGSLRYRAVCETVYHEGGSDLCRSDGPGLPGDASVSAQDTLYAYPGDCCSRRTSWHLHGDVIERILHQYSDDVRHGAGDRDYR